MTLLRRRPLWFDARVGETKLTQVLAFSRDEGYLLDGRALALGPAALELERVAWTLEDAARAGHALRGAGGGAAAGGDGGEPGQGGGVAHRGAPPRRRRPTIGAS